MIYIIKARIMSGGSSFVINKRPGETHYREEERKQAFTAARTTLSGYVRTIPIE
jgi:hypothetical protein